MTQEAIKKRQLPLVLADHENREIEVKSKCKFEYLPLDLGQEGQMYSVSERGLKERSCLTHSMSGTFQEITVQGGVDSIVKV